MLKMKIIINEKSTEEKDITDLMSFNDAIKNAEICIDVFNWQGVVITKSENEFNIVCEIKREKKEEKE